MKKNPKKIVSQNFPKQEIKSITAKHLGLNKNQKGLKQTDCLSKAGYLKHGFSLFTDKSKNRNTVSSEGLELDYAF